MSKPGLIINKYSIAAIILACLLLADIILHKGMSRVIIPSGFSDNIPVSNLLRCDQPLTGVGKEWRNIDNPGEKESTLPEITAGICMIVQADSAGHIYLVNKRNNSQINVEEMLQGLQGRNPRLSLWLKIQGLGENNAMHVLNTLEKISERFQLNRKIIIESTSAAQLHLFCKNGFFTSLTIPDLNPYQQTETGLNKFVETIKNTLNQYPASSISCAYFQYPALKKFFPNYLILTSVDKPVISLVAYTFNQQLQKDSMIKAILYNPAD